MKVYWPMQFVSFEDVPGDAKLVAGTSGALSGLAPSTEYECRNLAVDAESALHDVYVVRTGVYPHYEYWVFVRENPIP